MLYYSVLPVEMDKKLLRRGEEGVGANVSDFRIRNVWLLRALSRILMVTMDAEISINAENWKH